MFAGLLEPLYVLYNAGSPTHEERSIVVQTVASLSLHVCAQNERRLFPCLNTLLLLPQSIQDLTGSVVAASAVLAVLIEQCMAEPLVCAC